MVCRGEIQGIAVPRIARRGSSARQGRRQLLCRAANALEDNVVLYKTVDGFAALSTSSDAKAATFSVRCRGQWHTLRVEFAGTRFSVASTANHCSSGDSLSRRLPHWPLTKAIA